MRACMQQQRPANRPANACAQAVVSDVPSCGGVAYAQQHGIPTLTFPASRKGEFAGLSPEELVAALTSGDTAADYVLLAGFLKVRCVQPLRQQHCAAACAVWCPSMQAALFTACARAAEHSTALR